MTLPLLFVAPSHAQTRFPSPRCPLRSSFYHPFFSPKFFVLFKSMPLSSGLTFCSQGRPLRSEDRPAEGRRQGRGEALRLREEEGQGRGGAGVQRGAETSQEEGSPSLPSPLLSLTPFSSRSTSLSLRRRSLSPNPSRRSRNSSSTRTTSPPRTRSWTLASPRLRTLAVAMRFLLPRSTSPRASPFRTSSGNASAPRTSGLPSSPSFLRTESSSPVRLLASPSPFPTPFSRIQFSSTSPTSARR